MNKVILVGNLTRDPENSVTQNNTAVCKMTIAVNRNYTNAQGERESDFINIVAWRSIADNCARYLSKGKKIAVVGSLQTRKYEDKQGNTKYATEVVATEIEFLSPNSANAQPQEQAQAPKNNAHQLEPVDDDNLPF